MLELRGEMQMNRQKDGNMISARVLVTLVRGVFLVELGFKHLLLISRWDCVHWTHGGGGGITLMT